MCLTKAAEYGARAILYLAQMHQEKKKLVPIWQISDEAGIPKDFLAKILQALSHAGIVKSRRGISGGVSLARHPKTLTLLEVIEVVQGPMVQSFVLKRRGKALQYFKPFKEIWDLAQKRCVDVLEGVTIAELIGEKEYVAAG